MVRCFPILHGRDIIRDMSADMSLDIAVRAR